MTGKQKDLRKVERYIKLIARFIHVKPAPDVTFRVSRSEDYDGYPFVDYLNLGCYTGSGKMSEMKAIWEIRLFYESDSGERKSYDYIKIAAKSNTTAFKYLPDGPPEETGFVLRQYCHFNSFKNEEADKKAKEQLFEYGKMYEKLAKQIKTLRSWGASGIPMKVRCGEKGCGNATVFSSDQIMVLVSKGHIFQTLQDQCICKICGSRSAVLYPPEDIFLQSPMKFR